MPGPAGGQCLVTQHADPLGEPPRSCHRVAGVERSLHAHSLACSLLPTLSSLVCTRHRQGCRAGVLRTVVIQNTKHNDSNRYWAQARERCHQDKRRGYAPRPSWGHHTFYRHTTVPIHSLFQGSSSLPRHTPQGGVASHLPPGGVLRCSHEGQDPADRVALEGTGVQRRLPPHGAPGDERWRQAHQGGCRGKPRLPWRGGTQRGGNCRGGQCARVAKKLGCGGTQMAT